MIYDQHFLIGQQYMGKALRRYPEFHKGLFEGRPYDVHSLAWFCPTCGEVWARAILQTHGSNEPHPFRVVHSGCRKHEMPYHRGLSGSILTTHRELLPYLPDDMVRYEFNVLITSLEGSENE